MAGDWIKIEHVTPDKPEVFQVAEILGIDPDAVTGKLIRLWVWADQQTVDGNAAGVTRLLLDRVSGVTGFADALIDVGWIEISGRSLDFVNFTNHNGETAKKRAVTNRRVAKHREEKRKESPKCNADGVTGGVTESVTREEKRRVNTSSSTGASAPNEANLFAMSKSWAPSANFTDRLQMAGVPLGTLTEAVLGEFKSYWITEPSKEFTQSKWEHKLLQKIQGERNAGKSTNGNGGPSSTKGDQRTAVREAVANENDHSWAD